MYRCCLHVDLVSVFVQQQCCMSLPSSRASVRVCVCVCAGAIFGTAVTLLFDAVLFGALWRTGGDVGDGSSPPNTQTHLHDFIYSVQNNQTHPVVFMLAGIKIKLFWDTRALCWALGGLYMCTYTNMLPLHPHSLFFCLFCLVLLFLFPNETVSRFSFSTSCLRHRPPSILFTSTSIDEHSSRRVQSRPTSVLSY